VISEYFANDRWLAGHHRVQVPGVYSTMVQMLKCIRCCHRYMMMKTVEMYLSESCRQVAEYCIHSWHIAPYWIDKNSRIRQNLHEYE